MLTAKELLVAGNCRWRDGSFEEGELLVERGSLEPGNLKINRCRVLVHDEKVSCSLSFTCGKTLKFIKAFRFET